MVLHVVDRARAASLVDRVLVAAPDREIVDAVTRDGAEAMLTGDDHPNGTSRLAEVVSRLGGELEPGSIVVNVQGDEPELDPGTIDAVITALEDDPDARKKSQQGVDEVLQNADLQVEDNPCQFDALYTWTNTTCTHGGYREIVVGNPAKFEIHKSRGHRSHMEG